MRETSKTWLRHPAEWRQIAIVVAYWATLGAMFFVPACRSPWMLMLACALSFLNAVVIHNHLHHGIFQNRSLNLFFRRVLSFGNLYPASANIPAHNLVHHHFEDDGQWDWADARVVRFRWNLWNLIHFPNVAGPRTFNGVTLWAKTTRQDGFERQYRGELAVAFGLTGVLLLADFWTTLFFICVPQLYGARCILRINLLQHDRADIDSEWNHSRNFVGRLFNWIMCNNGYHTIHHNRAGIHWSELHQAHAREAAPQMDARLNEPSMFAYLARTYLFTFARPGQVLYTSAEVKAPNDAISVLPPRAKRRAEADRTAEADNKDLTALSGLNQADRSV